MCKWWEREKAKGLYYIVMLNPHQVFGNLCYLCESLKVVACCFCYYGCSKSSFKTRGLEKVRWLAGFIVSLSHREQHIKLLCFSLLRSLQVIVECINADFNLHDRLLWPSFTLGNQLNLGCREYLDFNVWPFFHSPFSLLVCFLLVNILVFSSTESCCK